MEKKIYQLKLFLFTLINYFCFAIFNILAIIFLAPLYFILTLFTIIPYRYTQILAHPFFKIYILLKPAYKKVYIRDHRKNKQTPTIYIANHQSILDMMIIHSTIKDFLTIAKAKYANFFPLNIAMIVLGAYFLPEKDITCLKGFYDRLPGIFSLKSSILIFPEGTRMTEEKISYFKPGAFKFSMDYNIPITPIVIFGTIHILKKSRFIMETNNPENVFISILQPVSPITFKNIDEFRCYCRHEMEIEYNKLRNEWHKKSKKNTK